MAISLQEEWSLRGGGRLREVPTVVISPTGRVAPLRRRLLTRGSDCSDFTDWKSGPFEEAVAYERFRR